MHLQKSDGEHPDLLVLDAPRDAATRAQTLARHGRIVPRHTIREAEEALRGRRMAAIVTAGRLPDGTAVDLCRLAQTAAPTAAVIVAGAAAAEVADIIAAGCDAVMLEPVEASLLCTRLGFVLRVRSEPVLLHGDAARFSRGTNQYCTTIACPRCAHDGAYRFDFTSRRRGLYACTACRYTWAGDRRERF